MREIRRALAQGVSDHLCFVFIATFVMSVKQLLHFVDFVATFWCVCLTSFTISAIVVVHCLDNCCLLFKKCALEGGCQGAPGLMHN